MHIFHKYGKWSKPVSVIWHMEDGRTVTTKNAAQKKVCSICDKEKVRYIYEY